MPYADPVVNREYHRQYQAARSDEKKAVERERKRLWALNHPDIRKAHYRKRKDYYVAYERNRQYQKMYGITLEDYDRMFAEQQGKCAICGGPQKSKSSRLVNFAVDHCHKTGRVRALLCNTCNVTVGRYEARQSEIDAYLERFK